MLLSIGMPVFNDAAFLPSALDSLLNQSFKDFELIISDDQSTDGSADICKDYALRDNRIKYIRQSENIGISANMKFLLNESVGKYFMWAANDDVWDIDFVDELVNALESNQTAIVAFCPYLYINEATEVIPPAAIRAFDYSANRAYERIQNLTKFYDDGFGYGIFVREKILEVEFPRWVWPNQKCAYNNIYPSLFFYLTKGDFLLVGSKPLWFNRIKNNPHHSIPYRGHMIPCYLAFVIRKINLVLWCFVCVQRASGSIGLLINILPLLFRRFAEDCWVELKTQIRNYKAGMVKLF
ncbi:MAG TPA: glycosyltransferase family 2 protein [Chryseolinea sp.]|nr:glycosyltransferase family 2 protein [Chryseolinea sp.]